VFFGGVRGVLYQVNELRDAADRWARRHSFSLQATQFRFAH